MAGGTRDRQKVTENILCGGENIVSEREEGGRGRGRGERRRGDDRSGRGVDPRAGETARNAIFQSFLSAARSALV